MMELKFSLNKNFCIPRDVAQLIWDNMIIADELGFKLQVDRIGSKIVEEMTIEYINRKVCEYYNIPMIMFYAVTRKREIAQARQIAMYFAKNLTKSSLETIGLHIGEKDHATVVWACKTVNNLIDSDKRFKIHIDEIKRRLKQAI